jgi:hypothetical protein
MPPIEEQRRASVTYARTSAFSDVDHQLIGHPVPTWGRCPQADPLPGRCSAGAFVRHGRSCERFSKSGEPRMCGYSFLTDQARR